METRRVPQRKPDPVPLPPINEIFRARVEGQIESQLTVNTFAWREDRTLPANGTRALIDALFAELTAVNGLLDIFYATVSSDWTASRVVIDLPTQPTMIPVPYSVIGRNGLGPAGHTPTTVSAVLHKRSTFKGRHGRGRIGVPGVPLQWVGGTRILDGNLATYQALANTFATVLNDGTNLWHPGVVGLDKTTFPTEPAKWALTWVDTVEGTVNPVLGNIRRRRPGRGK